MRTWLDERGDGVTSTLNVLETCGVLSFNLNRRQLLGLYSYFARRFEIEVLPGDSGASLVPAAAPDVFGLIARRLSFGDALVADAVDCWAGDSVAFVSWDARHFRGKISPPALTPAEFLEGS